MSIKASLRTSAPGKTAAPVIDTTATVVDTKTTPAAAGQKKNTTVEAPADPELESMVAGADATEAAPATNAVARTASRPLAVSVPRQFDAGEGFDGDWGQDDLKYPQLKQVQGSGPLSTEYDNGTIILGDQELLPPPSVKEGASNVLLRFVPVHIQKQFREKLNEEAVTAGEMPRIFNSIAEVEEAGLTTRWIGNTMPDNYAEASAKCLFLIEQPAGIEHPSFVHTLDGKNYAVAVYYAAGGAFRSSAKIIYNAAMTSLLVPQLDAEKKPLKNAAGVAIKKKMLHKQFWTLKFEKVKAGNFTPWRPNVKLQKEETGPELRAFVDAMTGATDAVAEAAIAE